MLHIGSHAQILTRLRLREPILTLDIVAFLLIGIERGVDQRQMRVVGEMACDVQRTEICAEQVLLPSVEIHAERLHILHRTELRLTVLRIKLIMIIGNITNQLDTPSLVGLIGEVGLVIEEVRLILTLRLHGS